MKWFDEVSAEMKHQGMSVDQLARAVGVHRTTAYGWLNGEHRPETIHIEAVATVLGMDPDALLLSVARDSRPTRRARGATKAERIRDLQRQIAEQSALLEQLRAERGE